MSADAASFGPSSDGNAGLARSIEPQFRVVTTGSRRRGVRLERVFWKLLDDISERRGLKRSKLIGEVLEEAGENTESVASILRCFAASTVDLERSVLVGRLNPTQTIALMQQAPVPAFSINRQKKLQQVNAEFLNRFNSNNRFARLYTNDDGSVVLQLDGQLYGGVGPGNFAVSGAIFGNALKTLLSN